MNLFSGLEKFGLKTDKMKDLFEEEESESRAKKEQEQQPKKLDKPKESDYLLLATVRCPVCDKTFKTKKVKSGKVRRLQPDDDLRPRHENIDTLKYEVAFCSCGYTAMHRYFSHISPVQIKLIREGVCSQMSNNPLSVATDTEPYDYDTAIELYKLAIFNTMVKKGKNSEKAYECLKISWLYRGKIEEMEYEKHWTEEEMAPLKKEEREFYEQAFEGLQKAMATEMFPICGMDETTLNLLLAAMGYRLGKYELSSRFISAIMNSQMATSKAKDRAREMKEDVLAALKRSKGEE